MCIRDRYTASVWPKGVTTGDVSTLMTPKKVYVIDYPLPADDNRFFLYLSKEPLSAEDKKDRVYACVKMCIRDRLYTTQCFTKEEGSHFFALRMAASRRATGLPSSVATINKGVYPGVAS